MRTAKSNITLVLSIITAAIATAIAAVWINGKQDAALLSQSKGRFSQLELALRNYYFEHKKFPPKEYSLAPETPKHSWRVLLLPQIDLGDLYDQFRLEESWDSEHNFAVTSQYGNAPMSFRSPFSEKQMSMNADYFTADEREAEDYRDQGYRIHPVTEGEDTFLLIEMPNSETHWMSPP